MKSQWLMIKYQISLYFKQKLFRYSWSISCRISVSVLSRLCYVLYTAPYRLTSMRMITLSSPILSQYLPKQSIIFFIFARFIISSCVERSSIRPFSLFAPSFFPFDGLTSKYLRALLRACREQLSPYFSSINFESSLAVENSHPSCMLLSIRQQTNLFRAQIFGGSISFFPYEISEHSLNSLYFLRRVEQPMLIVFAIFFSVQFLLEDQDKPSYTLNIWFSSSMILFVRLTLE